MKVKCYSVKIKELKDISEKAFKITCFDGSSDIFPKSAVYDIDDSRAAGNSIWIAAWILEKRNIQYSTKKVGYFNTETREIEHATRTIIKKHIPEKIEVKEASIDNDLIRTTDWSNK